MMHREDLVRYVGALTLSAALVGAHGLIDAHQDQHDKGGSPAPTAGAPATVRVRLLDETLLDQDGRQVKFASEVIAGRIVVMDFIYTTCTTICPVLTAILQDVQGKLGDKLGREVFIVSVSVDPSTDTPKRLKAYARKHKARPGWIFLTGGEHVIDKVLNGLGAYSQDFTAHPSTVLVGDARSGEWKRMYGFASPKQIVARVDELLAARGEVKTSARR